MKKKLYVTTMICQCLLVIVSFPLFFTKITVVDSITRTIEIDNLLAKSDSDMVDNLHQDVATVVLTSSVNQEKSDFLTEQEEIVNESVEQPVTEESFSETLGSEEVVVESEVVVETVSEETSQRQVQSDAVEGIPDEAAAKEEIARRESGGSYTAQNGRFYGRYQLDLAYLNGDLSPENQERVADAYVAGRYGSWGAALAHSYEYGWY